MTFASLIILSFNRKSYLQRSLESLWANTRFPYELIIMDDASNQETQDYIYSLVRARKVSTVLFNTGWNRGLGIAFNRGCAIAKGDYLLKLDADLEYKPKWLSQVVNLLDAHKEIGCLGLFKYWHEPCHFNQEVIAQMGDYYMVKDFVGSAICMRREIYEVYGPWEEQFHSFAEDVQFKQKVQSCGLRLALPLENLVVNFGFGENRSALIRKIDWAGGRHEYNVPNAEPLLFGPNLEQISSDNKECDELLDAKGL